MPDARSERAQVIVLAGPKGAGKTTLARMLEQRLGLHFLEVEVIAKRVLSEHGGTIDARYTARVFAAILAELAAIERDHRVIVIETTGAADETGDYLARLRERYELVLVRVHASEDTCAARIAGRDPSRQVDVPRELIREMHRRTDALALAWDLELDNERGLAPEQVCAAIQPWLRTGEGA